MDNNDYNKLVLHTATIFLIEWSKTSMFEPSSRKLAIKSAQEFMSECGINQPKSNL